jgi:hypothetical protein
MQPEYYSVRVVRARRQSGGKLLVVKHSDKKKVWLKIDRNDPRVTLNDVAEKIRELQNQHPDLDVFFDGDEFAICSRPIQEHVMKKHSVQMTIN